MAFGALFAPPVTTAHIGNMIVPHRLRKVLTFSGDKDKERSIYFFLGKKS